MALMRVNLRCSAWCDYGLPTEGRAGVYCAVLTEGTVRTGDAIEWLD
jgi:MOSC domain-containing protein YiiM